MRLILLLIIIALLPGIIYPQCCSVGIPTGGTTNVGIIPEGNLRFNLFYRYSYSNSYYEGSNEVGEGLVEGQYHFTGLMMGYGITNDLMIETEIGYFPSKEQMFKDSVGGSVIDTKEAVGLSNMLISAKYNILNKSDDGLEITLGAGLKIPFTTEPQYQDGVLLPPDLQPSTGAFGGAFHAFLNYDISEETKLFLIHKSEFNMESDYNLEYLDKYQYGNIYITSLFISHELFENLTGLLQLKNEVRGSDTRDGNVQPNTGGYLVVITPQLVYHFDDLSIGALFDYPIEKYYKGKQLAISYSFAVTLSYNLSTK
jgi:hypothetical protein